MAPVGSYESLHAAINAGADAIYFGVEGLNMRARSSVNFTLDDLREIASICDKAGVKSYLTVNTIIYDEDIAKCHAIIDAVAQSGISAIIASDIAAIAYARSIGVEVHISTQQSISNIEAVKFYARWADVVVLARELNLTQVKAITDAIRRDNICGPHGKPVRIEMFCHGALCMAVSGKCWLSLHTRGKSANRGECLQSCRRDYIAVDRERGTEIALDNGYFMSPKDLKTIAFLDLMVKAGVTVFKIEGRARGPEYVRTAVECYGEALDAILEGRWSEEVSKSWDERLSTVFNRGFWDGWYQGATMLERTDRYGSRATKKKLYCGKCTGYYAKAGVGRFTVHGETIRPGDELLVCGPTTGAVFVRPEGLRVDDAEAAEAVKGDDVTFRVPEKIRENDRLYVMRETVEDELA